MVLCESTMVHPLCIMVLCESTMVHLLCIMVDFFMCIYIHKDAVIFQSATDTICMGDRLCISTYDERLNEELLEVLYEMFPSSGW